ncbi:MAG TPA: pantoate--beta-alanine ligase [Ferruginibacter sp.]|nr:pantoate--beta-alanine ligase [Ferruginibacter sp.]
MILFKKAAELGEYLAIQRKKGLKTGFVPTMGALHNGHISLINACRKQNDLTICSIFVNPTQFNDPNDFKKYPKTIEADIYLLEKEGCDIVFLPSVDEIYPSGTPTIHYELGFLETVLEGKYRPGHFQGVCQVVDRLLQIMMPDQLFLGQKDYQQCMVIKKLIELTSTPTELIICTTQREESGLAMSSRNMRLSNNEKNNAINIYNTLHLVQKEIQPGDLSQLKQKAAEYLISKGFTVDYVEIANTATLQLIDNWNGSTPLIALAAAFLNDVRLIDNIILDSETTRSKNQ